MSKADFKEGHVGCTHDCMYCINIRYIKSYMVGTCDNPDSPFYTQSVDENHACSKMDEGK